MFEWYIEPSADAKVMAQFLGYVSIILILFFVLQFWYRDRVYGDYTHTHQAEGKVVYSNCKSQVITDSYKLAYIQLANTFAIFDGEKQLPYIERVCDLEVMYRPMRSKGRTGDKVYKVSGTLIEPEKELEKRRIVYYDINNPKDGVITLETQLNQRFYVILALLIVFCSLSIVFYRYQTVQTLSN